MAPVLKVAARKAAGSATNLAVTAAVQFFAGNWKFQVSGYVGGTTALGPRGADSLQLESGIFGTPLYLAEGDVQYNNNGIAFKALGCNVSLPGASNITGRMIIIPHHRCLVHTQSWATIFSNYQDEEIQHEAAECFCPL